MAFLGRKSGMGVEELSFFWKLELECNKTALFFLVLASEHSKIAKVKQLWFLVFVLFALALGEAADQTGHQQKRATSVRCYWLIITGAAQWTES